MKNAFLPINILDSSNDLNNAYAQFNRGEWETIKPIGDDAYVVLTENSSIHVLSTTMNEILNEILPSNDDVVYVFEDEKTAYRFLMKLDSLYAKV